MTVEEFQEAYARDKASLYVSTKCASCRIDLHEAITGCRLGAHGHVCNDCYFSELGESVEAHPIYTPRTRRAN